MKKEKKYAKSKRVGKIELLRFLFCILILLYHTGKDNKAREWMFTDSLTFFNKGFIGVDFFFLVTGYVTAAGIYKTIRMQKSMAGSAAYGYRGTDSLGRATWKFIWKKISAILPYHIVIVVLTIIFLVTVMDKNLLDVILRGIPDIFFLQMTGYAYENLIPVEWYISSMLLVLIIIYPLCLRFYDAFTHIIAPFAGFILSGYMILSKGTFGQDATQNGILTNGNVRAFAHICLGIFIFEFVRICRERLEQEKRPLRQERAVRILLTVVEPLCYLLVVYASMAKEYTREWLGTSLILLVIGVTISFGGFSYGQKLFDNRLCYFLGKASLPVYLVQNLVRSIAGVTVKDADAWIVILFTAGGTIAAGFVLLFIVNGCKNRRAQIILNHS